MAPPRSGSGQGSGAPRPDALPADAGEPESDTLEPLDAPMRLQRVLARAGIASRRSAEDIIRDGRVRVNGQVVAQMGVRVDPLTDVVEVDGIAISLSAPRAYLALNKPAGYVTTARDPQGRPTVMDLVPDIPGLFPVGRLDTASEGLLLLTNDGDWAQRVSHPRYGCTKEYVAAVEGRPRPATLAILRRPMRLERQPYGEPNVEDHEADSTEEEWTTGAEVEVEAMRPQRALLRITLHEGRNRQIRRMCEQVGHPVVHLVRVRVGAVHLAPLRPGEWRHLTHDEVARTANEPEQGSTPPSPQDEPTASRRARPAQVSPPLSGRVNGMVPAARSQRARTWGPGERSASSRRRTA